MDCRCEETSLFDFSPLLLGHVRHAYHIFFSCKCHTTVHNELLPYTEMSLRTRRFFCKSFLFSGNDEKKPVFVDHRLFTLYTKHGLNAGILLVKNYCDFWKKGAFSYMFLISVSYYTESHRRLTNVPSPCCDEFYSGALCIDVLHACFVSRQRLSAQDVTAFNTPSHNCMRCCKAFVATAYASSHFWASSPHNASSNRFANGPCWSPSSSMCRCK